MAGLAVVLMLGLLLAVLLTLQASHDRIAAQDRKIAELFESSRPVLRDARPLVEDVGDALRPLRGTGDDVAAAARSLPRLVSGGAEAAEAARPLLESLDAVALSTLIDGLTRIAEVTIEDDRLRLALERGAAALGEVAERDLLARLDSGMSDLRRVRTLQTRTLRVQLQTLGLQRRSLRVQTDSLAVQRESLRHIRSLDRKLGGEVPAP